MYRTFTLIVKDFLCLWLGKNSALTETPMVEARAARVPIDGT